MQKHCSCLWPLVKYFSRSEGAEHKETNEEWGWGEQAAEDGRKGIYIGLAFAMHEMQHPVPTS